MAYAMRATRNGDYQIRLTNALRTCRMRAGLGLDEMAALVNVRAQLGESITATMLGDWEVGIAETMEAVPAAVILAEFEIAGVRGLIDIEGAPASEDEVALERHLRDVRALLDDPAALRRRAERLTGIRS